VTEKEPKSKRLVLDGNAASASVDQPAFLSKPLGAPVYHGFPLIPETSIDGWLYGQSLNLLTPLAVPKAMDLFRLRTARELDLFGTLVRGKYRRSARLIRKGGAFTRSGFLGSCTTSMTYATASRMSCRRFVRNMRSCKPERPLTVETMNSNKVKMGSFRRFLTTSHSTKYLLFVLIGSWVWLWAALDYPPVLTYFGYSLVALVFLWTRSFQRSSL